MIRITKGKNGKKRYAARVHLGAGRYKMLGTRDTRKEAKQLEAEWELSRNAPDRVLAKDFARRFLQHYGETRKISSYEGAKGGVNYWLKTFGNRSLHTLTREECRDWASQVNSKTQKANRWAAPPVITMLNEAVEEGLIERNPMRGTSKKSKGRAEKLPLTVAEIDQLASIAQRLWGDGMEGFVRFGAYSGMRVGEMFALRPDAIDRERSRITIRQRLYRDDLDLPKSNKVKEVSLLPEALAALSLLDLSGAWVFTGKRGTRMSQSKLTYYWKPMAAAFGRDVTPHELRHFCGHHLYVTLGYPARVVAAQLTHSGPRLVEELYGHGDVGALEEIEGSYRERSNVIPLRRASNG